MSLAVRSYISDLFGQESQSDCTINFFFISARTSDHDQDSLPSYRSAGEPEAEPIASIARLGSLPISEVALDPLPAHLVILCGGSQRFRSQVERWTQQQKPRGGKPQLRVPLGGEEELHDALAAVRFMYSGTLDAKGAAALLRVRRLAAYLQVDGCVEACDTALVRVITADGAAEAAPLAGLIEVYDLRRLLPDPAEEPRAVHALMDACRQQLVRHSVSGRVEGVVSACAPSLGELLGWAFGDAPTVLSDPAVRQQMLGLSAAAMEALLGDDTFATDDEASVLLMLATWLGGHEKLGKAARQRLCKLVRLSHLNSTYLFFVLPEIAARWFPISPDEHRFLCEYAQATEAKRARMTQAAAGKYGCTCAWYTATARPTRSYSPPRSYGWFLSQRQLKLRPSGDATEGSWPAEFANGASRIVSYGFEWAIRIDIARGGLEAGTFLVCCLPTATLRIPHPTSCPLAVVSPGPARLVVFRWRSDGGREEAWSYDYAGEFVTVGDGWGRKDALQLVKAAGGGAAGDGPTDRPRSADVEAGEELSLRSTGAPALWSAFLHDGKLCGVLEWARA